MRTCSTVSMELGHVGHLSVVERCLLKRDWLRRDLLKRSRASVEASAGGRIVRYRGNFSGHDTWLW